MQNRSTRDVELIILLGLLAAIGPLSIDTYLPSIPAIANMLGTSIPVVQQSVSAYFLGLAAGQIVCGPFSDRFGRRPILFIGLVLYLIATLACVYAPTIDVLILGRAIQGLGASATPAAGRAVIRDIWSGDMAARAMSFVMMTMAFAPVIAPLLGGQIFTYFGWQAIFWLMAGFGLLLMALVVFRLPETNGPERRAGVKLGAYFRAYRYVLADRRAWAYLLTGGLSFATLFAYITSSSAVYIDFFGVDPEYFGFFFAINVVGLTLGNWFNSRYVAHFGYEKLLGAGTAISLLGVIALLLCALQTIGGLTAVIIALFIAVGPVSMTGANAIAGLLNLFPKNAGAASAMFGVFQFGLGAVAGSFTGLFAGTSAPTAMAAAMTIMAGGAFLGWIWLQQMERSAMAADT